MAKTRIERLDNDIKLHEELLSQFKTDEKYSSAPGIGTQIKIKYKFIEELKKERAVEEARIKENESFGLTSKRGG